MADVFPQIAKLLPVLCLALLPSRAGAAQGGWNASVSGMPLTYRGQTFNSSPITPSPTQGVSAANRITVIYWRYTIIGLQDPGLRVKLCTPQRCADLEGGAGQSQAFKGLPADSEFRFVYFLEGRGRVDRPIDVRQIDIAVNYE